MNKLNDLLHALKGHKIYIQTHNCPDPDAIASAFGLQYLLKQNGVQSDIFYGGEINGVSTQNLLNLLPINILNSNDISFSQDDYIILIDAQKYNKNTTDFESIEIACIDHHPTFVECQYEYADIRICGSCSSIITSYFLDTGIEIPQDVATALLFGLSVDTDNLSRGVTNLDVDAFYCLYNLVNKEILVSLTTNTLTIGNLKAYGAAIKNIKLHKFMGSSFVPFDCNDSLVAMISDFMLSVQEISVSFVFSFRENGYKFSVRSELENVHAGVLIQNVMKDIGFGGGHKSMAGGFIPKQNFNKLGFCFCQRKNRLIKMFIKEIKKMST